MKLMHAPGTCSLGIHVLLEEIGQPYELELIDLSGGAQHQPPYATLNPKARVPALLRDDGSVLTEFQAIAYWLARTNPVARLLPDDAEAQMRVLEVMDYVVGTMHMQGVKLMGRRLFFPSNPTDQAAMNARGRDIFQQGLMVIDRSIGANEYFSGEFSIADAALLFVEYWGAGPLKTGLPANCAAHYRRMLDRPAVKRVMHQEDLQPYAEGAG